MSWVVSIVHPTTEWDESTQPWESDTPKFPLLPYRGQPQGWAPTEAAAAEGPDSDAGCSRELCQGLLRATGPALSPAHQVDNTADSLSEHRPEHNAHQPGPPQADGLYHGPTSVLPGFYCG